MHLVDANVLIEAKNRYYAFDIAPGFWAWLEASHHSGILISIDAVREELLTGGDDLADWARSHRDFFLPVDQRTVEIFAPLTAWAARQGYTAAAQNAFSGDQADYLLVAHAAGHGGIVVTHEQPRPDSRRRVKIPDACAAMGVDCVDVFSVLRRTGAALHLRGEGDGPFAPPPVAQTIPGIDDWATPPDDAM